ncbi:MAG: helix-turn-helix transcriptional regulator [Clostridiales bacterium]|nr:helix-turn-helix transcriptional regulator [Clostridiales bacterium]
MKRRKPLLHLGKKLRSIRTSFGYTQEQIANALLIDRSTYSYYERETTHPDLPTVLQLCGIFQISPGDFFRFLSQENTDFSQFRLSSKRKTKVSFLSPPSSPPSGHDPSLNLSGEEKQLLLYYRSLFGEDKKQLASLARSMVKQQKLL